MPTQTEQADRLLSPDHYYLWGDRIVQAYMGDGWRLTCIDRQTAMPLPPAPDVVNGYALEDNHWIEIRYGSTDITQVKMGDVVEIDLEQFLDFASTGAVALTHGAVYSNGKHVFVAQLTSEDPDFVWSLYRVIRTQNTLATVTAVGELFSYTVDRIGYWREHRIADPKTSKTLLIFRLCPEFESEIMPTLEHIADSAEAFLYGH